MLTSRKIPAFSKKVADLPDTPSSTMTAEQIKGQMDAAPEEQRVAFNGAMDDLSSTTPGSSGAEQIGSAPILGVAGSTPYAQIADVKAQLNAATTGGIPDGSITPAKLSFDVATQAELNAVLDGATFTGPIEINSASPNSSYLKHKYIIKSDTADWYVANSSNNGILMSLSDTGELKVLNNPVAKIQSGFYTGDGSASRTIAVGFTPKFVYIMAPSQSGAGATAQLMSTGGSIGANGGDPALKTTTNGFIVGAVAAHANASGVAYEWVAIG